MTGTRNHSRNSRSTVFHNKQKLPEPHRAVTWDSPDIGSQYIWDWIGKDVSRLFTAPWSRTNRNVTNEGR